MRLVEGPGNGGQGVDVVVNEESGRTQAAAGDDAGAPGTDRNVLTFEVFLGNNLLAHDLTVNLEYKGLEPGQRAATPGSDFMDIPSQVIIPAGERGVEFSVEVFDDADPDSDEGSNFGEYFIPKIAPSAAYTGEGFVTVGIADGTTWHFDQEWSQEYATPEEGTPVGNNNDGVSAYLTIGSDLVTGIAPVVSHNFCDEAKLIVEVSTSETRSWGFAGGAQNDLSRFGVPLTLSGQVSTEWAVTNGVSQPFEMRKQQENRRYMLFAGIETAQITYLNEVNRGDETRPPEYDATIIRLGYRSTIVLHEVWKVDRYWVDPDAQDANGNAYRAAQPPRLFAAKEPRRYNPPVAYANYRSSSVFDSADDWDGTWPD